MILSVLISILAGLVLVWIAFVIVLLVAKPEPRALEASARIVPDSVRLIHALVRDRDVHRGVRIRLCLLLAYLVSPIDLIPDLIPGIGFADDVIMIGLVMRSVIKRAGPEAVREHWTGDPDGLAVLAALCRLPELRPQTRPLPRP